MYARLVTGNNTDRLTFFQTKNVYGCAIEVFQPFKKKELFLLLSFFFSGYRNPCCKGKSVGAFFSLPKHMLILMEMHMRDIVNVLTP